MDNQEKRIAKRRKQGSELVYTTDGLKHHVSAKGVTAEALAAAGAAIFGFIVGFAAVSRRS